MHAGRSAATLLLGLLALDACTRRRPPVPPPAPVRYVLEPAWQGDVWFYPHDSAVFDETGIGTVIPPGHPRLTTDNELYDASAPAAAMQAVQLPAIATVTNLDNGLQMLVRINDRGPASPKRLIAVTPRVAALLRLDTAGSRVRVRFDPEMTTALGRQIRGSAANLAMTTAPRGAVQQSDLSPLAGAAQEARRGVRGPAAMAQASEGAAIVVPARLAEAVTAGTPTPGVLMIDAGAFATERFARERLSQIAETGARVVRSRSGGSTSYAVRAGPFATIAEADDTLDRMVADGIIDGRIVIDLSY